MLSMINVSFEELTSNENWRLPVLRPSVERSNVKEFQSPSTMLLDSNQYANFDVTVNVKVKAEAEVHFPVVMVKVLSL